MRWPCVAVRRRPSRSRAAEFLYLARRVFGRSATISTRSGQLLFRDLVLRHQGLHGGQIERLAGTQHHEGAGAFASRGSG